MRRDIGALFKTPRPHAFAIGVALVAAQAAAGPFPPEFELSSLRPENGGDGSEGFIINGIDEADGLGDDITSGADLNGDGIDDIIVSSNRFIDERVSATFVVFSSAIPPGEPVFEASSLLAENGGDGSQGFIVRSDLEGDYAGYSLAGIDDLNGDGIGDVLIGGRFTADRLDRGESYVVFGRDTTAGDTFEPELLLSELTPETGGDGSAGFVMSGAERQDSAGRSVGAAGDINGDGIADMIVGAVDAGRTFRQGAAYIVFGRDTPFPPRLRLRRLLPASGGDGSSGLAVRARADTESLGDSVAGGADINGDGTVDLLLGATGASPDGSGGVYVVFGRPSDQPFPATINTATLTPPFGADPSVGFFIDGIASGDLTGIDVANAGDVNNDGVDDLIVGARDASPDDRDRAGRAYVVFGRRGQDGGLAFPPVVELAQLLPERGGDGRFGFILNGINEADMAGSDVDGGVDVNGDGIDDVVVAAPNGDPSGRNRAGQVFVIYGRDTQNEGRFPPIVELSDLLADNGGDGSLGFVLNGTADVTFAGRIGLGDVNHDGVGDLLIGAQSETPDDSRVDAGQAFIVYGRAESD
ncbi:MAG: integrin alpha [Pseudomonadota bacterium]